MSYRVHIIGMKVKHIHSALGTLEDPCVVGVSRGYVRENFVEHHRLGIGNMHGSGETHGERYRTVTMIPQ